MAQNTPTLMQSEEHRAPWNTKDNEEKIFAINVYETLVKRSVCITTSDYWCDEDGIDTSCVDWEKKYKKQYFTITQMMKELQRYVENDLALSGVNTEKGKRLKQLLASCSLWDEYEIVTEEE